MAEGEGKEVKERRRREKAKKLKRQGSPLLYEKVLILWKKSRIPTTLPRFLCLRAPTFP